jgi:hypothetical protein
MTNTLSKRVFYIPASRTVWGDFALEMASHGLVPTIWLGDWRNHRFGTENFPDCVVLGLKEVQATLPQFPVVQVPDADFLVSREFLQLKAQSMKLMDRQDETRSYGRLERDAYFYAIVTRLYSLIVDKRIDVLVASEAPHHVAQLIAYRLCEMLGIPTYHLVNNTYVPLVQVHRQIVGSPIAVSQKGDVSSHGAHLTTAFDAYRTGIPVPLYMANQAKRDRAWMFLPWAAKYWRAAGSQRLRLMTGASEPLRDDVQIRSRFPFRSNTRRFTAPVIIERLRRALEREYPRHTVPVDLNSDETPRFVYFPMPFEPERTSLPDGGDFFEAMDALLALREYVPDDVHIFVKEHPTQFSRTLPGYKARSPLLYSVMSRLPNTRLIDIAVPSSELVTRAEFTAVITGTAALESALIGKPGVVFGTPWFAELPGIHRFDKLPKFSALLAEPDQSVDDIIRAATVTVERHAIPGVISVEQMTYFEQKFGDAMAGLVDDGVMIRTVANVIAADLVSRKN